MPQARNEAGGTSSETIILDRKVVDYGNGWQQIITIYKQPRVVSPAWWAIWRNPIVKMQTFTSSAYVQKDGALTHAQLIEGELP